MNAPCFPSPPPCYWQIPPVTSQCFLPIAGGTMYGPLIMSPVLPFNMHSMGASSINIFDGTIRLGTATNVTPQDGDFWFDGTHLNFQLGTTHVIV